MIDAFNLTPDRLGISAKRLGVAADLIDGWARSGEVPAASFTVGRRMGMIDPRFAGTRGPGPDATPIRRDALFLAASLTKPITAIATIILVERGLLTLDDPVVEHIPEFAENGKSGVLVRHLLTHTSGLPDRLPDNDAIRAAHGPLSAFVAGACRSPLLFGPGTAVSYQSLGFAILGELVLRVAGVPLVDLLRNELFGPLGMSSTTLGWNPSRRDRQTAVRLESGVAESSNDWHWNTSYWLGLGAPWGGLVTSPCDYGRVLQMMLNGGSVGDVRILSPASVRAMVANGLDAFPDVPEADRRFRPWGLGWRLHWPGSSSYFGDLIGPRSFGHWGSTGTLAWADPDRDAFAVILTSRPPDPRGTHLARLSNVLASAFL